MYKNMKGRKYPLIFVIEELRSLQLLLVIQNRFTYHVRLPCEAGKFSKEKIIDTYAIKMYTE